MSKKFKRLSFGILLVAVLSAVMMLTAVADYSGTDTNISWTLDTSNGTLTVNGNGAMPLYAKGSAPWYQYRSNVKSIVVTSGVTVSNGAFYGMELLESITVPYVGDGNTNTYFGFIFGATNYFQNVTYVPESLKTVTVSGSTAIASYAFNNVSGIEKIVLADTVTTVNSYAFKDCSSLERIVLGKGIKTIGSNAFKRCDALKYVMFDGTSTGWSGVTVDSTNSLSPIYLQAASLTVTAPAKTEYALGENLDLTGLKAAFGSSDVTEIVEISAPDMTTVGAKAVTVVFGTKTASFTVNVLAGDNANVSGVITWSISADGTLTLSGNGMMDNYNLEVLAPWYAYRDAIKKVVVSEGVTSIGAYAFYHLDAVTSITLPTTVETVEYAAFEGCSALKTLTLGNASAVVDGTAFRNCEALVTTSGNAKYITVSGNANYALVSVDSSVASFTIPTNTVVIAEGAFEECTALTSITIPASVKTIGDSAFASCSALTSVTLGTGVRNIGNYAFADCGLLSTLTFNSTPDYVGAGAFNATALTGTVSGGAVYLGTATEPYMILWKAENAEVTSVTVNANTKVIASLAFANCALLESVELNDALLHIGDSAFYGCSALTRVTLPNTLLTVGDSAFNGCTLLASATLPKSLKTIGNSAFRGTAITSAVIDANVENVGYSAFRDCTSLAEVVFSAESGVGYKTFAGCTELSDVYLADSVLSVGEYAFMGCTALKAIAIPDTVGSIGAGALYGCAVTELAIPFIGEKANGKNTSYTYIFGADAPKTFTTLLVGSDLPANALDGITSIGTLIIDKTASTVASSAVDATVTNAYYLGSSGELSIGSGNTGLANIKYADSTFDVSTSVELYLVGDLLDREDFTANLGDIDVTSLIRFANNPIVSSEAKLPAKLGSVSSLFVARSIPDIEFTNYSLLLEGSIGVKCYVKLSKYAIDDLSEITAKVNFKDNDYDVVLEKAENTVDGTIYVVKFYVAAKEMHEPIKFIVSSPEVTETFTVSVKDYVDYVNNNKEEYAECLNIVNEMFNYGEYSRQYFIEGAEITANPDLTDVNVTIPSSYNSKVTGSVTGVTYVGSSLLLESNTTIRHYFKLADGTNVSDYKFVINGVETKAEEKDGHYYVDIKNIIARDIGKLDSTTVSAGDESMTIVFSPLTYAKLIVEDRVASEPELKVLVKALYRYYVAAADYFKATSDDIVTGENESKPSIW